MLDDAASLASAAADRFCAWLGAAIESRGEAHVALTGGSSAGALYTALRAPERRAALDWRRLHLWWGDERFVPLDHRESNAGLAIRILFESGLDEQIDHSGALPIPSANVHPVPCEEAIAHDREPAWAAERYAEMLRTSVPHTAEGLPALDLILLGLGTDGHILSAFPGSAALAADAPAVLAVPAPTEVAPHLARITLATRVLGGAGRILVMVPGPAKAEVVARVLHGDSGGSPPPACQALLPSATWLLDRDSASSLG